MELTELQNTIASRIDNSIKEQESFIKEQKAYVHQAILGEHANGYTLRQNLLCLNTAEKALELLQKTFADNIGMSHEAWVKANNKAKPKSDETILVQTLSRMFGKK